MVPQCSPGWAVSDHPKDQLPNLLRRRVSSNLRPDSGDQPPIHTKTTPVPATVSGMTMMGLPPSRPDPPSDYPEELIEEAEARARMSTLQRDELLTQREILEEEKFRRRKRCTSIPKQSARMRNMIRIYSKTVVRWQ